MEGKSEDGGGHHVGGIRLVLLTDSDNYCDEVVLELNRKV